MEVVAGDWLTCGEVVGLGGQSGGRGGAEAAGAEQRAGGVRGGGRGEGGGPRRGHGSGAFSLPLRFFLLSPFSLAAVLCSERTMMP
jgi:hypothetical protein